MIRRRRRPHREIAFSFDSFLDVVANVVGIILRLILVAWVGARAYHGQPPPAPPAIVEPPDEPILIPSLPEPTDSLADEIERKRHRLAEAEAALLAHLRERDQTSKETFKIVGDLNDVTKRKQEFENRRREIDHVVMDHGEKAKNLNLSAEKLSERAQKLTAEIEALSRAPIQKNVLRYRTPVSQPVSQELMCELAHGRVCVVDRARLEEEAARDVRSRIEELRNGFELRGVSGPIGAFRYRYLVQRSKDAGEAASGIPLGGGRFTAQFVQGVFEPISEERGETIEAALKEGSAFRRVIDSLDPQQTAITLWVYPDSFASYRKLRDYLHDREIVVAGRPLPEGLLIGVSLNGSQSRGQ